MQEEMRTYWLGNWEGSIKRGYFFRSDIAKDIFRAEKLAKQKVIGLRIERKESGSPSFTIELLFERHKEVKDVI